MPPPTSAQITQMQTCVSLSSKAQVVQVLNNSIKNQLSNGRWIGNHNRYLLDCISRITSDANSNSINSRYASEYIAVSSILHCKDGWEYLSGAVSSLLSGNYRAAVHLAYYAELRAAMSFLASDGIGVFNSRHVYINSSGEVNPVLTSRMGTHQFVWFSIEQWANHSSKSAFIFDTIEVGGRRISDWVNQAGLLIGSPTIAQLASDWLKKWSLDLQLLSEDHNIRNEVSYRPRGIKTSTDYVFDFYSEITYIFEQWKLCEPISSGNLRLLDYILLREALIHFFSVIHGSLPKTSDLDSLVNNISGNLGLSLDQFSKNILTKRSNSGLGAIFNAGKLKTMDRHGRMRPLSVIARAFLLLRIASASNKDLLKSSVISGGDLTFWRNKIGIENGFWANGNEPDSIIDLWADVKDTLDSIESIISNSNSYEKDSFFTNCSSDAIILPQFQRVFLWSLGL